MGLIFTIVGDIFSPAERGRYQGFFSGVWGLAAIFGPTLGGWLTDHVSWRATFYVNLPVGIIAIAAIYFEFPDIRPQAVRRVLDWAGVFTLLACMGPLLLAFTWVTEYGWGSGRVETLLAIAAVMLIAFLYSEIKAVEPLIPLTLFNDPVIRVCFHLHVRAWHGHVRHDHLPAAVHAGRAGRFGDAIRHADDAHDAGLGDGQLPGRPADLSFAKLQDARRAGLDSGDRAA